MATFYIDPSVAVTGDGSELTPFKTWAEVTFGAGNSYLQKRGTTSTVSINLIVTGTSGNRITFGAYGVGDRPIIHTSAGNCITANGREYVTIKDLEVIADAGTGINFFVSDLKSATGVLIQNVYAHDCLGVGIAVAELPGKASYQAMTDCIIEDCISDNNGNHGISMSPALTKGCIIRRCTASNNGLVQNAWGIYMRGRGIKYVGTAWTQVAATTAYEVDAVVASAMQTGEVVVEVAAPGRTNAGDTNPVFLTEGTWDSLNIDEWSQLGDLVQVNTGENPDSRSVVFVTAKTTGCIIEDCTASHHTDTAADGVGIGFDHVTTNGIIRRCISHDNAQDGFQVNVCKSCRIESCITYNNNRGIQVLSTDTNGSSANLIINNTSYSNITSGFYIIRAPSIDFVNNITYLNGESLEVGATSVGFTTEYNNHYNNTADNNTDATDIFTDPLLDSNNIPDPSSPVYHAGKTVAFNLKDFKGHKFNNPPTIGAYEFTSRSAAKTGRDWR